MRIRYVYLTALMVGNALLLGQTARTKPVNEQSGLQPLKISQRVPMKDKTAAIVFTPKCDQDGNVYVRFYNRDAVPHEPVYKFNKEGQQEAVYSLQSDVEFQQKGAGALDFAIGKDGNVYLLASSKAGDYIITYAKNGAVKSKVKLAVKFQPFHFGVFDSGEFLITGGSGKYGPETYNISTAVFDRSGALSKSVELPEDKPFVEAARRGDAQFAEPGDGGNFAAERGQVTGGSDGNIYVVRWTDPARIYAIAPSGDVVHTFEVKPDWEGRKPDGAYSHAGLLALYYGGLQDEPGRSMIRVVRLDSGEGQASYDISGTGTTLTCYTKDGFTFLGGNELLFAQLQ